MKIIEEKDFENEIASGVVIVDFFAVWCGPCRMINSVLEEVEENNKEVKIVKVNVDDCENLSRRFGIMSIPTLLFFKDGKEVKKHTGFATLPQIQNIIDEI